jgi:polyketide cyclase/dehydrase/lipid transport protein
VATFENTVLIARPIEDVFAFLSDLENIPKWNYAIVETRKISEGPVGVGTTYHQVRSVPGRSEERLEITTYDITLPTSSRFEASLGPSGRACCMPWTPSQREPGSRTRWSSSSAVLAACSGVSPCHVSGTPWPPTSGSSKNCWRDSMSGHPGGTNRRYPPVTGGHRRQVDDLVDACWRRRAAGREISC